MSYPPYPGAGDYPAAHPDRVDPEPKASGGTAIAAGVLAAIGGAWHLINLILLLTTLGGTSTMHTTVVVTIVGDIVLPLLLISGCVLLFMRRSIGRTLVAAGSVAAIAMFVINAVLTLSAAADKVDSVGVSTGTMVGIGGITVVILSIPAIVTLILVLLPATARWIRQGQRRGMGNVPTDTPPA